MVFFIKRWQSYVGAKQNKKLRNSVYFHAARNLFYIECARRRATHFISLQANKHDRLLSLVVVTTRCGFAPYTQQCTKHLDIIICHQTVVVIYWKRECLKGNGYSRFSPFKPSALAKLQQTLIANLLHEKWCATIYRRLLRFVLGVLQTPKKINI